MIKKKTFMCGTKKIGIILICIISLLCSILFTNMTQAKSEQMLEDGTYKVALAINRDYVWDIANGSTQDGANLQIYKDNGTDSQKFVFAYLSDGYYSIVNVNSNKVIECSGDKFSDQTNMQQSSLKNIDTQCWKLLKDENGYYTMICKSNGMAADVRGGAAKNGTNMQVYQQNHTASQKFEIMSIAIDKNAYMSFDYFIWGLGLLAAAIIGMGHAAGNVKPRLNKILIWIIAAVVIFILYKSLLWLK